MEFQRLPDFMTRELADLLDASRDDERGEASGIQVIDGKDDTARWRQSQEPKAVMKRVMPEWEPGPNEGSTCWPSAGPVLGSTEVPWHVHEGWGINHEPGVTEIVSSEGAVSRLLS
ncbi:MAG: hypothetical protein ACRDG9_14595 [Actinomycetota bacterium]